MNPGLINEFLRQKKFAVAGSFRNESKVAYRILKDLISKGYEVYPVNPNMKKVEELTCYASVLDIPETVGVVDLVTPPEVTEKIVEQCAKKGITRIWMQPGAESEKAIELCKSNNIKVVHSVCVMMHS